MKYFIKKSVRAIAAICAVSVSMASQATIDSVRAVVVQKQLSASTNNVVNVTWQVGTSAGHTLGASDSLPAQIWDISTNTGLLVVGGALVRSGAGPFTIPETLNIPATKVQEWLDAGETRVIVRRVFTGGNTVIGTTAALSLVENNLAATRNGASELSVQRVRIGLDENQSAVKIIAINGALEPTLTINYAGTGLLEGKWQVAEPGSTEGKPLYRTLALVRQPLVKAQESTLKGPVLPSNRIGKYLVRFCVTPSNQAEVVSGGDSACPLPALTVQTAYQVIAGEEAAANMAIKSPVQESVNNETPFSWAPVKDAALYKLDVFETQGEQQWFVTGILLPNGQTQTVLSQLMQQKLTGGSLYAWQVSAVNAEGKVIAQSNQAVFSYQP